MIKAVLFDMDGTIFDTEAIYRRAWIRAAKDVGFNVDMDRFFELICGLNMADMTALVHRVYGEDVPFEEVRAQRRVYIEEDLAAIGLQFKSGAPEILYALKEEGIRIALVTSSGRPLVDRYLRMSGLEDVFDVIMTGETVAHGKPHPEIFLTAAAKLGIEPQCCMVVEDSPNGIRAGHAAGMYTVMVPDLHPYTEALHPLVWRCCDALGDLLPLIEKENQTT